MKNIVESSPSKELYELNNTVHLFLSDFKLEIPQSLTFAWTEGFNAYNKATNLIAAYINVITTSLETSPELRAGDNATIN
jgi:hypothetical protein